MKLTEDYIKYCSLAVIVLWSLLGGIILGENNARARQQRLAAPPTSGSQAQSQQSPSLSGGGIPMSVSIQNQGLPVQVEIAK